MNGRAAVQCSSYICFPAILLFITIVIMKGHHYIVIMKGHQYIAIMKGHVYIVIMKGHHYIVIMKGHYYIFIMKGLTQQYKSVRYTFAFSCALILNSLFFCFHL